MTCNYTDVIANTVKQHEKEIMLIQARIEKIEKTLPLSLPSLTLVKSKLCTLC